MKEIIYRYTNTGMFPVRYIARKNYNQESQKNLNRGYKTKGISEATQKKIKTACRILSYAAKQNRVRNSKGEYINHLCMFITLTLPYNQENTDQEITKICLGDFLDRCRKIGILNNYVWRAEKQKNGNIHYHILTDSFTNYSLLYRFWLMSLQKLNYVKKYSDKFKTMNFTEYRNLQHNRKIDIETVKNKYAKGVRENWLKPPCIKVDYCNDISQVGVYIAKYNSKADAGSNIVKGRVWSASQSISKVVEVFKKDQEFNKFWYSVGTEMMKREVYITDFFSVCKFSYSSLIAWFTDVKEYVNKLLGSVFEPCQFYRKSIGMSPI